MNRFEPEFLRAKNDLKDAVLALNARFCWWAGQPMPEHGALLRDHGAGRTLHVHVRNPGYGVACTPCSPDFEVASIEALENGAVRAIFRPFGDIRVKATAAELVDDVVSHAERRYSDLRD